MGSVSAPIQPEAEALVSSTGPRQLVWTILWMTMLLCSEAASVNPHQPVKITWKLQNGLTREMLTFGPCLGGFGIVDEAQPGLFLHFCKKLLHSDAVHL